MIERVATIIGSTGLIGQQLVKQLREDTTYQTVRVLVRRPAPSLGANTETKLVAFDDPESFRLGIEGSEVVFCAVGTTMKKVKGDKAAYRRVDFDIPVQAARLCAETGCSGFYLVSSVGANSASGNFYLKLKGETEEAVTKISVPSIGIFQPSILLGDRNESRPGERFGQAAMQAVSFLMVGRLKRYRPVEAAEVAAAMITAAKLATVGVRVYGYEEIKMLSSAEAQ